MKHDTDSTIPKEVITYAAGICETKIAEAARNSNQPESELREWVGIFLLSSWTGISNSVSKLRGTASKMGKAAQQMEMVKHTSRKTQKHSQDKVTKAAPSNKKGFKYNGTHWMQQPKNRKRVMEMARKRAAARIANKKVA